MIIKHDINNNSSIHDTDIAPLIIKSNEEIKIKSDSENSSKKSKLTVSTVLSKNSKAINKIKYFKFINTAESFWENIFCFRKVK